MSDTPRTDEQINGKPCTRFEVLAGDSLRNASVPSEFARELERELNIELERANYYREMVLQSSRRHAQSEGVEMSNHLGDTNKMVDEAVSFCPHCHSGNDPVLKDTTWSCGVRFNDALWRTKECYKRQIYVGDEHLRLQEQHISELGEENGRLKQRIKRLEEACGEMVSEEDTYIRLQTWHKAKEAKL